MKVIFEKTINGVTAVRNATTPAVGDQGLFVRSLVGVGNPFWAWPSIPSGKIIAAEFDGAPICSNDPVVNNAAIADIAANGPSPSDVLIYA